MRKSPRKNKNVQMKTKKKKKPLKCESCHAPLPKDYPLIYCKTKRLCKYCWLRNKNRKKWDRFSKYIESMNKND